MLDNPMFVGKIRYNQYENWAEKRRKGKTAVLSMLMLFSEMILV
ncbi:hypothetical protein LQV63_02700 [Paenibacillus profundus]|uniref:Recombinase domain-containing protein n=1 Tax=Paenibacillus profundus TaxID=1173085 RepID=A0ABS8Y8Y0_9BACL|nr:hypothetical protein [Paenibacillus profundus]